MAHKNLLENRTFNIYREIVRERIIKIKELKRTRREGKSAGYYRNAGKNEKNTEKKEREKRACQDKDQTSKKEGKESKDPDTTGSMRGA
ncbi:hypothetical protein MTP99_012248 [Tenebrio molitor]|nr:hypothetical protein MTP99_012248 [Tenebrio molitor]